MSVMFHQLVRRFFPQVLAILLIVLTSAVSQAAQITLAWDANNPAPDGYRVFLRNEGETYNYASPAWPLAGDNPQTTTCTIANLSADTQYYFVVRAFAGEDISGDSNEISYHTDPEAPATYILSASAGANGSISPATVSVDAGGSQTFTITPDPSYHVADVLVDGRSVGAVSSYTFSQVSADHAISAAFDVDTFTISAVAGANGSISPATAAVDAGGSQTFTITPDPSYHVTDVLVDGQSVGAVSSYTFSQVSASHTISAAFDVDTFTISAVAGANGSISPAGSVAVNYGSAQTFTISPDAGYRVADVLVDGQSIGAVQSYSFNNVATPHAIEALFEADAVTITASAGTGGMISPSGQVQVANGADQSFVVTVEEGYEIRDLIVDGVSMGIRAGYTFSNVSVNHDITAMFMRANQLPVADAGPDQVADEAQLVTLSGLNSHDPDDGIVQFEWRQIQGDPVVLSSPEQETTTFTTPDVDMNGQSLVFELTVTDTHGATAKDTCIVNVTWVNEAPVAGAGADQNVSEGSEVTLDATASMDADDGIGSYSWLQVQGPQVVLSDPQSATPHFTAPDVGREGASLVFELTVTDAGGLQDTDTCAVTVTWNNIAPVADAGPDQQVAAGNEVTLDGSLSVDPDGASLLYHWSQTDGQPVVLSDATAASPVFTVPVEGFDGAVLTFQLTVTDDGGLQGGDTCQVAVQTGSNVPPDADTVSPVLTILNPAQDYTEVSDSRINITGTATDNMAVDRVVWSNDRGQSGTAAGTDSWHIYRLRLHRGTNTFTITAFDASGNSQSKTITIELRTRWKYWLRNYR